MLKNHRVSIWENTKVIK